MHDLRSICRRFQCVRSVGRGASVRWGGRRPSLALVGADQNAGMPGSFKYTSRGKLELAAFRLNAKVVRTIPMWRMAPVALLRRIGDRLGGTVFALDLNAPASLCQAANSVPLAWRSVAPAFVAFSLAWAMRAGSMSMRDGKARPFTQEGERAANDTVQVVIVATGMVMRGGQFGVALRADEPDQAAQDPEHEHLAGATAEACQG